MTKAANRNSWKTLPLPDQRECFEFPLVFTDAEFEHLRQGHVPEDMDDKWFVFFENEWLYFHRSWTGACIFGVQLDGSSAGARVVEAWASRDRAQYQSPGIEQERELLEHLIRSLLPT